MRVESSLDFAGALYDAGNAAWTLEDPLTALKIPAPYLVTSGIRDSAVWETPDGVAVQWLALGEGSIGIEAVAKRFGELCPAKPLSLEIINTRMPRLLDSWTEECWDAYRDVPASFLARFQKLGRNGNPYSNVPPGPPGVSPDSAEFKGFLVEPERRDIEQVVKVFKRPLGLGEG